jgi:signal transduction histidine kinase
MTITAERLRRFDIFSGLSDEDLVEIAQFGREESHPEGDVLLAEDAPADWLFLVEQGKLSLEIKIQLGRGGKTRLATIGYVEAGKAAGWSSLTPPYVYVSAAVCVEPTRVIVLDGTKLRRFMSENPHAGLKMMTTIAALIGTRYQDATNTLTYFLSIVSHELRAPLAAIENYLQVMLGGFAGELTDKQQRMLERSALRVNDLRSLISDIVDLARMRPEQIQADFEWFDPGEVGTESFEDVRLAAKEKGVKIKLEPPPEFLKIVGARRRLRQVLTNLLANAIKFSPPGSTVAYRARYEPDALIFEVEDEGVGIPAEDQPHIFEDFFRASNIGEAAGAGLGLSIAKKIMDAHQGQIMVTSPYAEDKTGTRFTVVIPRNLQTPEMRRGA